MIKVLIVEDSRVSAQYLEYILGNDPGIEVMGIVENGRLAVDYVKENKPDIVTMDIDMPVMNGLEATRKIMESTPVPIIIVTASRNAGKVSSSMEALAAGALTLIQKPYGIGHPLEAERTNKLLTMVKIYSKVKVIKRKGVIVKKAPIVKSPKPLLKNETPPINLLLNKKLIVIGISSGGPQVLAKIFSKISANFPYPILVVQHITEGFLGGMVSWLDRLVPIPVQAAKDEEKVLPGHIYFAPDSNHMGLKSDNIELQKPEQGAIICPSVKFLFNSLSKFQAKDTIAMILTGMGSDGAKEIKTLKDAGAITIAQDEKSSLVFGMPGVAIKQGGIDYIQNPDQLAELLLEIEKKHK